MLIVRLDQNNFLHDIPALILFLSIDLKLASKKKNSK